MKRKTINCQHRERGENVNYRQLHENIHADFVFEKKLKSGQRGNIYLVRDKNTGERSVYRHFYGNAEVYESLVNITCPNLPKITRTGEEDGKVLVLEEYIQGDGLDFILEGGALTFGQTRDIAIQVCRALCILHSVGAVHRDVKPENIILRGNEAVLIDFDASRMYKLEQTSDTRVMGTTGYAAPEQYGFSQTDARADLYAVGVLINEMLTNRHPATCLAEGPMRPIIEKCIEVNVDKRYLSADELLFALEALTDKNIAAALEKKKRQSAAKKLLGITAVAAVFVMGMLMGRIGEEESEAVSGSVQTSNLSTVTSSEPVSKKMPAVEIVREVMPAKPEKTDFEKIGILSDVPIDLIWDGVTRIEPFKRNGTYQVQNGAELAWIASRINSGENIDSIELTDDIDLGGCQWEPIEKYSGEFDGNGHTISGMKIDSKALENNGQHLGLFGTIAGKNVSNAVIKNFTLGGEIIASSTEQIHDG